MENLNEAQPDPRHENIDQLLRGGLLLSKFTLKENVPVLVAKHSLWVENRSNIISSSWYQIHIKPYISTQWGLKRLL